MMDFPEITQLTINKNIYNNSKNGLIAEEINRNVNRLGTLQF